MILFIFQYLFIYIFFFKFISIIHTLTDFIRTISLLRKNVFNAKQLSTVWHKRKTVSDAGIMWEGLDHLWHYCADVWCTGIGVSFNEDSTNTSSLPFVEESIILIIHNVLHAKVSEFYRVYVKNM